VVEVEHYRTQSWSDSVRQSFYHHCRHELMGVEAVADQTAEHDSCERLDPQQVRCDLVYLTDQQEHRRMPDVLERSFDRLQIQKIARNDSPR